MDQNSNRLRLIEILQLAYSGELAAAYAYHGHWKSVKNIEERSIIRTIEEEEWHHRKLVGEMLTQLGAQPHAWREKKLWLIGRTLGLLCYITGWFAPMYGAGRLESKNVREYETAARYARLSNHDEFVECLLLMAEVEWDHEKYFRTQVESHFFSRIFPLWKSPPPRENIRASFLQEAALSVFAGTISQA